jgi:hypothetical protein
MTRVLTVTYDLDAIGTALHVSSTVAKRLGQDGRVMSPWINRYLETCELKQPYLLRMLTETINFARSVNHGAHRDETFAYNEWCDWIRGYRQVLIADLMSFPVVPVWSVTPDELIARRSGRPAWHRDVVVKWVEGATSPCSLSSAVP